MADSLVLIHGTNGSAEETRPIAERMPRWIETFAPNWLGHGGRPPPRDDYCMGAIVEDLVLSLDRERIDRCFLFGYSIGGYAALVLAHLYPERVCGIVTLATRHLWHEQGVGHLVHLAAPERLTRPGNGRAAELAAIHHPTDWRLVNGANRRLFAQLGEAPPLSEDDLRAIPVPVLVMNGTADPLVPVAETQRLAGLFSDVAAGIVRGQRPPVPIDPAGRYRRDGRRLHRRCLRARGRTRRGDCAGRDRGRANGLMARWAVERSSTFGKTGDGSLMLTHRIATEADIPAMRALMAQAIDTLQTAFLSPDQVAASRAVMGLDSMLVRDRTYYAVEGGRCAGRLWRLESGGQRSMAAIIRQGSATMRCSIQRRIRHARGRCIPTRLLCGGGWAR